MNTELKLKNGMVVFCKHTSCEIIYVMMNIGEWDGPPLEVHDGNEQRFFTIHPEEISDIMSH